MSVTSPPLSQDRDRSPFPSSVPSPCRFPGGGESPPHPREEETSYSYVEHGIKDPKLYRIDFMLFNTSTL